MVAQPGTLTDGTIVVLQKWLQGKLPNATDLRVTPIDVETGGGASAELFFIKAEYNDEEGSQVKELTVRREDSQYQLFLDASLERHGRILQAVNQYSSLPVPECIGYELDESIIGAPFLVMSRVYGEVVKQFPNYNEAGCLHDYSPAKRYDIWKNIIENLAALHQLDWQKGFTFLNNPARGAAGLDQYLNWFYDWYQWTARGRRQPIADMAMDYLLAHRPDSASVSVLWGDPHQSNFMFDANDGSVSAILDWELTALGPGEIDLAYWLYFDEHWCQIFKAKRLDGLPTRDEVIAIYEQAAGRKVSDMKFYDVLASLRMVNIIRRTIDRLIGSGVLKADSQAGVENFWTQHLARVLGVDEPELHPDFLDYLALMEGKS
jgi:aminoglycoside phosphotransferase (APT) family kinase protein